MTGRASPFRSCVTSSFFSRANLPGRKIALSFASTVLRKSNPWLATSSRASNGCLLYAKLVEAFSRRIQVIQIDGVNPEPLERAFGDLLYVLWPAIQPSQPSVR